jgi:hypothetical protein
MVPQSQPPLFFEAIHHKVCDVLIAARIRRDERRARALLTELEEPPTLRRAAAAHAAHLAKDGETKEFIAHFHRRNNQDVRLTTARDQWDMRDPYNDAALTYRQVDNRLYFLFVAGL